MRLGKLLLVFGCSVCNAAPAVAVSDGAWLLDPVGAVLAEADTTAPASGPASDATKTGPEGWISVDYGKLLWDDTKETATAPLHWDADEWRNFGLISGGLAISVAFLDKPIRDAAQRSRSSSADDFFRNVEKFGTKQYGLPVLFGFYAVGVAVDDYNAKTVALDGFSASVISSLTTSVFKGIAGRARPNSGLGPHHWNLFGGDQSFPSGHADFSEDTYRVLTAVDSALMVIDCAKGVEERTIKLMKSRSRPAADRRSRRILQPAVPESAMPRILFVCVENSNRSQMAEAFARVRGGGQIDAASAGSRPSGLINPRAIAFMRFTAGGFSISVRSVTSMRMLAGAT